jgi:Predicted pPIWI-associating nuclease
MNESAQQLSQVLEALTRRIRRIKALHVNRAADKDAQMQNLLRLTQNRSTPSDFRKCLNGIRHSIDTLELRRAAPVAKAIPKPPVVPHLERLIASLRSVKPSAAQSFEQGLLDLQQVDRKSWRGTTVEFREALREALDELAPDEAVLSQSGYKQELDAKGPTMKQKAVFILKSRRPRDPQVKAFGDAIDVIEELIGKFVRSVYTRSSVAVHVADSKEEAKKVRDYVALVLGELLEAKE